jgi:glycosyltransferase involved in cell wall biosynthesis
MNENGKRILIVYPHNFFEEKNGINSRFVELLKYFKARGISADLLALKNFKSSWEPKPLDKEGWLDEIFLFDFKKGARGQQAKNKKSNPWARLRKYIPLCPAYSHLSDFAYPRMKRLFHDILRRKTYHYVLISYVFWANLLESMPSENIVSLLDLSDFTTLNRFDRFEGDVRIGPMIDEEIRRVNLFDKVICISENERHFFSQFAKHPNYYYIPYFMSPPGNVPAETKEYDIVFVGSDNPHNRKGIQWFFKHVFPLLENSVRLLIVGNISRHVKQNMCSNQRITCLQDTESLHRVYDNSGIAICPLLGGSGMKIKVVEALSFGLPVVTTSKGIHGFPSGLNTGCRIADSPESFAEAIHLLLNNPSEHQRYRKMALDFFRQFFQADTVYKKLDRVFDIPFPGTTLESPKLPKSTESPESPESITRHEI